VQSAVFLGHSMGTRMRIDHTRTFKNDISFVCAGAYDNMLFYLASPENQTYVRAFVFFGTGPGFGNPKVQCSSTPME
jgi:hypothetical protein